MSLSRLLGERHGPAREFFEDRLPNLRGFQGRWRACGPPQIVAPPDAGSLSTIGAAFDYRLRYFFVVTPPYEFVAARGAVALATRRSRDDGPKRFVGCMELFDAVVTGLTALVDRTQPVGRRLAPTEEADLCRYCYLLGLYEAWYRMGPEGESPLQRLGASASVNDALALVPEGAVTDLCALAEGLYRSDLATRREQVLANPTFAGSALVGGADADLILGDCLIDIKVSVQQRLDRRWIYQLIGYALLDIDDAYGINEVGFYHARIGALLAWDLQTMLDETAGTATDISALRGDFQRILA